jgi:hypothetical protein
MREPAWRLFAAEYNDAQHVVKGEGDKAPTYVVTPLGARVNRLFIVGVLTDVEDIGTEGIRRRARISDPTGIHVVYAESFNPEVAGILSDLDIPCYVAVVGKARTYEPEEGMVYTSVRAEMIKEVSLDIRNFWIVEACRSLLTCINAVRDGLNMTAPAPRRLQELGYPPYIAEGVVEAIKAYKNIDVAAYEPLIREALSFVTSESAEITKNYAQEEATLLAIIEELQEEEGAPFQAVADKARQHGLDRAVTEEVVVILMEKGMVYEPQLGRLKLV